MPEELSTEVHNTVQEAVTKTNSKKKNCEKEKQPSEEGFQVAEEEEKQKVWEKGEDISN